MIHQMSNVVSSETKTTRREAIGTIEPVEGADYSVAMFATVALETNGKVKSRIVGRLDNDQRFVGLSDTAFMVVQEMGPNGLPKIGGGIQFLGDDGGVLLSAQFTTEEYVTDKGETKLNDTCVVELDPLVGGDAGMPVFINRAQGSVTCYLNPKIAKRAPVAWKPGMKPSDLG